MNTDATDYSPLRYYSWAYKFLIFAKRFRMLILRGAIIGLLAALTWIVFDVFTKANQAIDSGQTGKEEVASYDVSFSGSFDLTYFFGLFFFWIIVAWIVPYVVMYASVTAFAKRNNYSLLDDTSPEDMQRSNLLTDIKSFRGKLLARKATPLVVLPLSSEIQAALFTRIYKEGGLLRWRERKMDTILVLETKYLLPWTVINATGNERARFSNLSTTFDSSWKFQFEGIAGKHYDVFTDPATRVEVLQLFTPDVLEVFYEQLPMADIEIRGNKIWIIQRYLFLNDVSAKRMIDAADALMAELGKQARLMRPEEQMQEHQGI